MSISLLKPAELQALKNLAKKQSGEAVEFINIADARTLTDLGLASRSQQGWEITAAGVEFLGQSPSAQLPDTENSVTPFPQKPA